MYKLFGRTAYIKSNVHYVLSVSPQKLEASDFLKGNDNRANAFSQYDGRSLMQNWALGHWALLANLANNNHWSDTSY